MIKAVILALLVAPRALFAQEISLNGRVIDPEGKVIGLGEQIGDLSFFSETEPTETNDD